MDSIYVPTAEALRPKLDSWMRNRRLSYASVAAQIGVSREAVRRYCLKFGDDRRAVPSAGTIARIVEYTGGEVRPADFYDPELNGPAAGETVSPASELRIGPDVEASVRRREAAETADDGATRP